MLQDGKLVRRRYIDALLKNSGDRSVVKVVTGMRGVGKTVLMEQFVREYAPKNKYTVISYDFDDVSCIPMKSAETLRSYALKDGDGTGTTVIVLHEVQKLQGWEEAVADLVNLKAGEIFITASDDSVLSLSTVEGMAGKVCEIRLYPLSLPEFMEYNGLRSKKSAIQKYLSIGGLPMVRADMAPDVAKLILQGVFSTAMLKDVLPYGKGIDPQAASSTAYHIMANSGTKMDSSDIASASGTSFRKASAIVDAMASCFLAYENEGRSFLTKLMHTEILYYAADLGLRNCISGAKGTQVELGENALMIELKRLGYSVKINGEAHTRSFSATDDNGTVIYSICEDEPLTESSKCMSISMNEDSTKKSLYTLSRYLSE